MPTQTKRPAYRKQEPRRWRSDVRRCSPLGARDVSLDLFGFAELVKALHQGKKNIKQERQPLHLKDCLKIPLFQGPRLREIEYKRTSTKKKLALQLH